MANEMSSASSLLSNRRILAFDVATLGADTHPFAIYATVYDNKECVQTFSKRCLIINEGHGKLYDSTETDISCYEKNVMNYMELIKDFALFYLEELKGGDLIVHVNNPMKVSIFEMMLANSFIKYRDWPNKVYDVAHMLHNAGYDINDAERYNLDKYGLKYISSAVEQVERGRMQRHVHAAALSSLLFLKT